MFCCCCEFGSSSLSSPLAAKTLILNKAIVQDSTVHEVFFESFNGNQFFSDLQRMLTGYLIGMEGDTIAGFLADVWGYSRIYEPQAPTSAAKGSPTTSSCQGTSYNTPCV